MVFILTVYLYIHSQIGSSVSFMQDTLVSCKCALVHSLFFIDKNQCTCRDVCTSTCKLYMHPLWCVFSSCHLGNIPVPFISGLICVTCVLRGTSLMHLLVFGSTGQNHCFSLEFTLINWKPSLGANQESRWQLCCWSHQIGAWGLHPRVSGLLISFALK